MKTLDKLNCFLGFHRWTSKAEQGIKPAGDEIPKNEDSHELLKLKFCKYTQIYCQRCGREM